MHKTERENESCLICMELGLRVICFYLSVSIKLPSEILRLCDMVSKDIQLKLYSSRKGRRGCDRGWLEVSRVLGGVATHHGCGKRFYTLCPKRTPLYTVCSWVLCARNSIRAR